jgi:hypothetical protein
MQEDKFQYLQSSQHQFGRHVLPSWFCLRQCETAGEGGQYDKSAIEIMQKLPGPKSDAVFYYAQVSSANDYMSSRQYDVAERYLKTLLKQPAPTDWRKRQYDVLVHVLTLS